MNAQIQMISPRPLKKNKENYLNSKFTVSCEKNQFSIRTDLSNLEDTHLQNLLSME